MGHTARSPLLMISPLACGAASIARAAPSKSAVVQHREPKHSPPRNEGLLLAIAGAANGYIVVAPNYAGYDTSSLTYHPYLNADQQADDMIDSLETARIALEAMRLPQNGQVNDGPNL